MFSKRTDDTTAGVEPPSRYDEGLNLLIEKTKGEGQLVQALAEQNRWNVVHLPAIELYKKLFAWHVRLGRKRIP